VGKQLEELQEELKMPKAVANANIITDGESRIPEIEMTASTVIATSPSPTGTK
jgi:hypothetical protein